MISVTIGSPVFSRASISSSSPSYFRPWNAYGLVRGLNAPPRRKFAPASLTSAAIPQICSSLSTEQGPAISARRLFMPTSWPPTWMVVGSGWNILFAFLNGSATCITRMTFRFASIQLSSILLVSPTRPRIVRSFPTTGLTSTPFAISASESLSISFWGVPRFIITIMAKILLKIDLGRAGPLACILWDNKKENPLRQWVLLNRSWIRHSGNYLRSQTQRWPQQIKPVP